MLGFRVILAVTLASVLSSPGVSARDTGGLRLSSTSGLTGVDIPQVEEAAGDEVLLEGYSAAVAFYAMLFVLLIIPLMMVLSRSDRAMRSTEDPSRTAASGSFFTSDRERRLWAYTVAVMLAIYSTLSPAQELSVALRERGILGVSTTAAMVVVGLVIALHWAKTGPGRLEIWAGLGIAAIYLTTMIRMPVPEARSHLFEYGLVALLIDQALTERKRNGRRVPVPPLLALVATAALGWIDEGIQALLPNRVYDIVDVGQNAAWALWTISASVFMRWVRSWDVLTRIRRTSA